MIRSSGEFHNNGDGYVLVHFRNPNDLNGNHLEAWVAFDIDTGLAIAVSDTQHELEGDALHLTVWVQKTKMRKLIDRMWIP